jgi:tagatose 6-phosphate kinase
MILVVNLNLAIDQIVEVDELRPGAVHRARATSRLAGGKGVNVARVLRTLGERCVVTGFLGGRAGEMIAADLRAEGISFDCAPIRDESRTCLILSDGHHRCQTVINEAGPRISRDEMAGFTATYRQLLRRGADPVVITGSLPPGLPQETYADLISHANQAGCRTLFDSSSAALRHGLGAGPFMVKVNHEEAGEALQRAIKDFADAAQAADELIGMGPAHAMITLGARGALLAFEGVKYCLVPPLVQAVNSVGSGDAVMAGLAAGLRRGDRAEEIGALAIAAGAANALHGAGRCAIEEIRSLQPQVICRRLI